MSSSTIPAVLQSYLLRGKVFKGKDGLIKVGVNSNNLNPVVLVTSYTCGTRKRLIDSTIHTDSFRKSKEVNTQLVGNMEARWLVDEYLKGQKQIQDYLLERSSHLYFELFPSQKYSESFTCEIVVDQIDIRNEYSEIIMFSCNFESIGTFTFG